MVSEKATSKEPAYPTNLNISDESMSFSSSLPVKLSLYAEPRATLSDLPRTSNQEVIK